MPDSGIRSAGATSLPCVARRTPRSFSTTAGTCGSRPIEGNHPPGRAAPLRFDGRKRHRLGLAEHAGAHAPQRFQVGAAAEPRAELVRQRPDVEPGRAAHAQVRQSPVVRAERQGSDRDGDGAKLHGLVAPGQLVGRHAVDLLGRVRRRHLRVRAAKLVERPFDARRVDPFRRGRRRLRRDGRRRRCRSRRRGGRRPRIPSRWR